MLRNASVLLFLIVAAATAAGPRVDVVVSADASRLERFAAEELSAQLKRLFDAEVKIASASDAPQVIEVGRQQGVSEQTIVLKSVEKGTRSILTIGGGSPAATLWAVYEYGHRQGIRYFLFGDLDPVTPPKFTLTGFDVSLEPAMKVRSFPLNDASALGPRVWERDESQKLLRQLAKLKFNQVVVSKKSDPSPISIRVDGDTAGRSAFRGAKQFVTTEPQRLNEMAQELGISVIEGPDASVGVLPRVSATLSLAQIGDLDITTYHVSRTNFGAELTREQACHDLITPVCGEEVSTRVWKAMELCQQASVLLTRNDPTLDLLSAEMLLKQQRNEPPPAWWTEVRDHYLNAMNEMYRANTRAREGGRAYTLYHARRFEFAFQYMNCLIAVRKAGVAKAQSNDDVRVTELETAVEAIYGSLNALAAVARSSTDRAVIALLNEYGYRPLKKELDAAGE